MVSVAFRSITKIFPNGVVALDHLDLTIGSGEMFGLVGPSGCGKSTALRILSGLETPTAGTISIDDRDVTDVPTRDRDLGLVTQGDTLQRRLTGAQHVRFPLEVRARRGRRENVGEESWFRDQARELRIGHLLDRRPDQMSDGERRALLLARAVIASPDLLLLDEPLAFTDSLLRQQLRNDIVAIQRRRAMTALLVTADQSDAMATCDRVGVLFDGQVHQAGSPTDIYDRPATAAVAAFFGEPAMNIFPVPVRVRGGEREVELFGRRIRVRSPLLDVYRDRHVLTGFRPDQVETSLVPGPTFGVSITSVEPLGYRTNAEVDTETGERVRVTLSGPPPRVGSRLELQIRPDRLHWFDPDTGMAILHPITR